MFGTGLAIPQSLEGVAHIIQVALTPVFLLSGIAALLNVFATRLGRVADALDKATEQLDCAQGARARLLGAQLAQLRQRSVALDVAVVAGILGGAATCGATIALFVGALREDVLASVLFALFGGALVCTLAALTAFLCEMLIAGRSVRARLEVEQETADRKM